MADSDDSAEWRKIQGFEWYEVSDTGRVRRVVQASHPHSGVHRKVPFEIKPMVDDRGRRRVALVNEATAPKQKKLMVSRLVAEAFIGASPSPAHVVCHRDGDHTNNDWRNLRWDTQQGNIDDRASHGTTARGSKNGQSKLTEADVSKIRKMLDDGHTQQKVAEAFGIDQTSVSMIKNRKIWQHVK